MGAVSVVVDNAHFMVRCLRYRLRTERLEIGTMLQLDFRGGTVLDIGANNGIYSFWMRRVVGKQGRVVAFEPQPELYGAIVERKKRFGWHNVQVLNLALSDADGHRDLTRKIVGDGSASLEVSRHHSPDGLIPVATARLDALPPELLADLKFIKCDVEGHEYSVFLGGVETLRRHRPVIQFESTVAAEQTEHIFRLLGEMNYSGVMFLGGGYLPYSNPDKIPHYKFGSGGHRNFLFFPVEAIGTIIPRALAEKFPAAAQTF